MYETILYEVSGNVARLTMNRPDKYNAFTGQMLEEMKSALKKAAKDREVRCVLLMGAGKAFNAGQDLGDVQGAESQKSAPHYGEILRERYNPLILQLYNLEKPVIAVIQGAAAGAGMSIALACDLRIMSEKAYFVNAFVSIGLVPDSGGCYFLPRLVGLGKAIELAMTGERIPAEEAYRLGLANHVCSAEQLAHKADELAAKLARMPTRAIGLIKRTMYKGLDMNLAQTLEYEAYAQEIAGNTEDHREGIQAFLEKRLPSFKGV